MIEGHLRIVMIEKATAQEYVGLKFPNLREITDYFLMFRVTGLQSLAEMFPNLSVIRGQNLLHDYAFIIYEMVNMRDIGLQSLTTIVRGGVRIEDNPYLCFVDTIDWSRISSHAYIAVCLASIS